jgi:hypothetical protein
MAQKYDMMAAQAHFVRGVLRKDWDWWTVFEGDEGTGKSNLAIWWSAYVSGKDFNIKKHITYEPEEFLEIVESAPRYGTVMLDEAGEAWNVKGYATKINRMLSNASQQMRDRNLNVVLCVPSLTLLDKHCIRRVRTDVKITAPQFERGYSEWCEVVKPKYGTMDYPYLPTLFFYNFIQLPPHVAEAYKSVKTEKGKVRMARYIDEIKKERGGGENEGVRKLDAQGIYEEIAALEDKSDFLGARRTFNWIPIKSKFDCTERVAKEAAFLLNKAREATPLFA